MGNVAAAKATIPLIFIFFLFYDLAYTPILIAYALEILPFKVRAKGFAIMVRPNASHSFPQEVLIDRVCEQELHHNGNCRFQPVR